jgi:hypothetical protein
MRAVLDEMNSMSFESDFGLFARFQLQREEMGEWGDAVPYSRSLLHLTLGEVREFFEEYIKLVNRFKRDDAEIPDGTRQVFARFLAFPAPDGTADDDESG